MQQTKKIEAIDVFCGIGGLTYGLRTAGINVKAGFDNDPTCAFAYEKNNHCKFIHADITRYDLQEMNNLYSKDSYRILVGCAPCQPFSSHTNKLKNKQEDTRWDLITYFYKSIEILEPHVISMENVQGITKTIIFKEFIRRIEDLGYLVDYEVVYCPEYGIPQNRKRLVLLGSKFGKIQVPKGTYSKGNYITVKDTIGNLPKLKSGETDRLDPMHRAKNLSQINLLRIKQSQPNGNWQDWNPDLLPNCYKKNSGQTYKSVYGRMSWDNVSPTITTQFFNYGSGRFGHPEQDRALSLREGALLQTFPTNYDFGRDISLTRIGRQIGNAVPPKLGFEIGKSIKSHLELINGHNI